MTANTASPTMSGLPIACRRCQGDGGSPVTRSSASSSSVMRAISASALGTGLPTMRLPAW